MITKPDEKNLKTFHSLDRDDEIAKELAQKQGTINFPLVLASLPSRVYWESLNNDQLLKWLEVLLPFYRDTNYLNAQLDYLGYQEDLQIPDQFTDKQLLQLEKLGGEERAGILVWLISRINPQEIQILEV